MYQNISEWLTVDYLIAHYVLFIYFHQTSNVLTYILEVIVMHSPYAHYNLCKRSFIPPYLFCFL